MPAAPQTMKIYHEDTKREPWYHAFRAGMMRESSGAKVFKHFFVNLASWRLCVSLFFRTVIMKGYTHNDEK